MPVATERLEPRRMLAAGQLDPRFLVTGSSRPSFAGGTPRWRRRCCPPATGSSPPPRGAAPRRAAPPAAPRRLPDRRRLC